MRIYIRNIRNINEATIDIPFEKGIFAFVGENGCGKSTLMLLLSLMVKASSKSQLSRIDYHEDSLLNIKFDGRSDDYKMRTSRNGNISFDFVENRKPSIFFQGFYEGSIYYGSRFYDFDKTIEFMQTDEFKGEENVRRADSFVIENFSYILKGNKTHYKELYKIKSKKIASKFGFEGIPYFLKIDENNFISQFSMSSGESMLVRLTDFINNIIVFGKPSHNNSNILFIVDEVELALHPSAIVRLVDFFEDIIEKYEDKFKITVFFSTHSTEIINKIPPRNIFMIENIDGKVEIINPCYPNYAVRQLYIPNGYDILILVEDELARIFVEKTIRKFELSKSKLICVLPSGGYNQTLKLHKDILGNNVLGLGKKIISILDGDCKNEVCKQEDYKSIPKLFLPIDSIEKFLYRIIIESPNREFIKFIGDKYFTQRSLSDIVMDFENDSRTVHSKNSDGKNFYKVIISNLKRNRITEDQFIDYISDDILNLSHFKLQNDKFKNDLEKLL